MSTSRHTIRAALNDETREALRTDLIRGQLDDAEAGLEMILDGTYAAEVHYRNALEITRDTHRGMRLARLLADAHAIRLTMGGMLGNGNSDTFRRDA